MDFARNDPNNFFTDPIVETAYALRDCDLGCPKSFGLFIKYVTEKLSILTPPPPHMLPT